MILKSDDNSWSPREIPPNGQDVVKFNNTGLYEYRLEIPRQGGSSGEVVVLGSNVHALPVDKRVEMATAILKSHSQKIPLVGAGVGDILYVTIHKDELQRLPDAKAHYKKKIKELIPFDVAVEIGFRGYATPEDNRK